MSQDAEYNFDLAFSPAHLYNFDLNYDLQPESRSITPYPLNLLPGVSQDEDTPSNNPFFSGENELSVPGANAPFAVTLSSSPERATSVIDLTRSPQLQRHHQMGNTSSAYQDIEPSNSSAGRAFASETSEEMARRRTARRRSSTTSADRAHQLLPRRASTVSLEGTQDAAGGSRRKRRRVDLPPENEAGSSAQRHTQPMPDAIKVEEVNLTEVNDSTALAKALSKQREDAVKDALQKSQTREDDGRTVLTSHKCPICMDVLEDATSTVCGHLFCHRCIIDTLKFSEMQRSEDTGGKAKGTCPVCRKPMIRSDKADRTRTLVPLALKLQVVPRNRDKGKGKEIY